MLRCTFGALARRFSSSTAAASGHLSGRVAVVTGSTSGIGHGIASVLASHGADIMLHGFGEPSELNAQKDEFAKKYGVKVGLSTADLSGGKAAA